MNVGVTVFLREGRHHLWENGIGQNALFLLMLLDRLPQVSRCFLVNDSSCRYSRRMRAIKSQCLIFAITLIPFPRAVPPIAIALCTIPAVRQ